MIFSNLQNIFLSPVEGRSDEQIDVVILLQPPTIALRMES